MGETSAWREWFLVVWRGEVVHIIVIWDVFHVSMGKALHSRML